MIASSIASTIGFLKKHPQIFVLGALMGIATGIVNISIQNAFLSHSSFDFSEPSTFESLLDSGSQDFDFDFMPYFSSVLPLTLLLSFINLYFIAAVYRFIRLKDIFASFSGAFFPCIYMYLAAFLIWGGLGLLFIICSIALFALSILLSSILPAFLNIIILAVISLVGSLAFIYLLARFLFVDFAIAVGGLGPMKGIMRSFNHSKGHVLGIMGAVISYYILYYIISFFLGIFMIPVILISQTAGLFVQTVIQYTLMSSYYVLVAMMYIEIKGKKKHTNTSRDNSGQNENIGGQKNIIGHSHHIKPIVTVDSKNPDFRVQWPPGYKPKDI